jgi:Niemann-Pick C1 protein
LSTSFYSLVMLGNLPLTVLVLACVGLTLVDVIGMLFFWGITIDTISCMCIVLVVGLCVDYSVHIAHAYNVADGKQILVNNMLLH